MKSQRRRPGARTSFSVAGLTPKSFTAVEAWQVARDRIVVAGPLAVRYAMTMSKARDAPQVSLLPNDLWCEGKALTATRALTDDESAWTRRKRRSGLFGIFGGVLCMTLPFAVAIMLFMAGHPAGPPRRGFDQAANVVLIIWTLAVLPAGILVIRDAVRRRARLHRDLAGGHVWDFAEISVLPTSRVLVRPEERRGQSGKVARAAPRPLSFYPVPFEVLHDQTGEQRHGTQRNLSDAEAQELATHSQAQLWTWYLVWPALIGAGWIVAALRGERPALGALGVVGFLWIAFRVWRMARIRHALRKDAAMGVAVTVPTKGEEPEHEFLPESGMIWTIAGVPANWRFLPVAPDD